LLLPVRSINFGPAKEGHSIIFGDARDRLHQTKKEFQTRAYLSQYRNLIGDLVFTARKKNLIYTNFYTAIFLGRHELVALQTEKWAAVRRCHVRLPKLYQAALL
jgi:hypothetical protein